MGLARRKKIGLLEKSDAFAIMAANRLGYEILTDERGSAWYRKNDGDCVGPFKGVKSAVKGAINEYDRIKWEEFLRHEKINNRHD